MASGREGGIQSDEQRNSEDPTAARNLGRAGVPRSVAVRIAGHRTETWYRRYTITSDADQRDPARRLSTFLGTPQGASLETHSVSG